MTSATSSGARFRAPEILSVLKDHGQLTARALNKMIVPRMNHKKLVRALERLQEKGLVEKRDGEFRRPYYFLSQAPVLRTAISGILKCHPDELIQPLLKRKDWHHQELCEYWIYLLKKVFPEATIVRDRHMKQEERASDIMFAELCEQDLYPDILLIFPKQEGIMQTSLAVEIERTRKSNERLIRKLKNYTTATSVSGVLYVCDSGRLADTIRLLYQTKANHRLGRSHFYPEHYFLFSDAIDTSDNPLSRIFSAEGRRVNMRDWSVPVQSHEWYKRRDEMFNRGGDHTPSIIK